jgi:hypothetical protein
MDAVAANGIVTVHRLAIPKHQASFAFMRLEPDAVPSEMKPLGPQPRLHGLEQDRLQVAPMDRELGRAVARPLAERFLVDELPEAVEERRLRRLHRNLRDGRLEPKFAQDAHGMRQQIDADADGLDLRRRLVDPAGNTSCVELQGQRQAADSRADDQNLLHCVGRCLR